MKLNVSKRVPAKSGVKHMITVFLSYSKKDHFFAELASINLEKAGIKLWRDRDRLIAGEDWRQGIERGISASHAVLVALSQNSVESSYVTYEWAYAIGQGKTVIPIKLGDCSVHPKLETIQYLDFSIPGALPWDSLIERIQEMETSDNDQRVIELNENNTESDPNEAYINAILDYLNQRGYQRVSFERIRKRINENLTDELLSEIVRKNKHIFRFSTLKGNQKGLAKLIP
jgi:hypothetical protein